MRFEKNLIVNYWWELMKLGNLKCKAKVILKQQVIKLYGKNSNTFEIR